MLVQHEILSHVNLLRIAYVIQLRAKKLAEKNLYFVAVFFVCSVTLLSTFNSANMLKLWTCGLFAYGFIKPFVCKMTAPKLQVHFVNSGMVIVYYIAIIISYKGITFV